MKKTVLALSVAGLCLAASAHSSSDGNRQLGRQDDCRAVPEATPTFALVLMSFASLGVVGLFLGRKSLFNP